MQLAGPASILKQENDAIHTYLKKIKTQKQKNKKKKNKKTRDANRIAFFFNHFALISENVFKKPRSSFWVQAPEQKMLFASHHINF